MQQADEERLRIDRMKRGLWHQGEIARTAWSYLPWFSRSTIGWCQFGSYANTGEAQQPGLGWWVALWQERNAVLLHFTPSENVQDIAEHGLHPRRPAMEKRRAVWLVRPEHRVLVESKKAGRVTFEVNDALLEPHLLQVDAYQPAYMIYTGLVAPRLLRVEGMRRWGPPFEKRPMDMWPDAWEWCRRLLRRTF